MSENQEKLQWNSYTSVEKLDDIIQHTAQTLIIFKHSTRCPISRFALKRFTDGYDLTDVFPILIEVRSQRDQSNYIAEKYDVVHESPQVIVVNKEGSVKSLSHEQITIENIHHIL